MLKQKCLLLPAYDAEETKARFGYEYAPTAFDKIVVRCGGCRAPQVSSYNTFQQRLKKKGVLLCRSCACRLRPTGVDWQERLSSLPYYDKLQTKERFGYEFPNRATDTVVSRCPGCSGCLEKPVSEFVRNPTCRCRPCVGKEEFQLRRENMFAARDDYWSKDENIKKASETAKSQTWRGAYFRQINSSERSKEIWACPKRRQHQSESMKKDWVANREKRLEAERLSRPGRVETLRKRTSKSKSKVVGKKMTLETLQARLDGKYGAGTISIEAGQEYPGVLGVMRFADKDYGVWETTPYALLKGNTHPERSKERRRRTNLERYGHENAFGSAAIKEKIKKRNLEKYGVSNPAQASTVKEKIKATNIERYGCAVPLVGNGDVKGKAVATMLDRYGVENAAHDPNIQTKKRETCLDRYGVESPLSSTEIQQKIKSTNLERRGVEYPTQAQEVKDKVVATNLEKFGGHPLRLPEYKEKVKRTCIERYGVSSPRQINSPVLPNGMLLSVYIKNSGKDLCYSTCKNTLDRYGFEVLKEYVEGDRKFGVDTTLEWRASQVLGIGTYKKCLKNPYRYPDFELVTGKVYLDVDGLFWHSEFVREDNHHHFKKRLEYEKSGRRLIQIREDEVMSKPQIVKSIIGNALGRSAKVHARKGRITEVPWHEASIFLEENHLQGKGPKAKSYGLVFDGALMMLLSVRRKGERDIEIARMCSALNTAVVGGFSRLLKQVIKDYAPDTIYSWCDMRYATGKGYEEIGFVQERETLGWRWTDFTNTFNRRYCRADKQYSEREKADSLGIVRIYDAGQRLYAYKVEPRLYPSHP